MNKGLLYTFLLLLVFKVNTVYGQFGGKQAFDFLELPKNAHLAAIGGFSNATTSSEASAFLANPAALETIEAQGLSFGHQFYYADVGHSVFAASIPIKGLGNFGLGFESMSYGEIEGFDAVGNATGTYSAADNAFTIGKSHCVGAFSMGVNLKMVFSAIEDYRASALLFDIGGIFKPSPATAIGVKVEHLGTFLSSYTITDNADLPFDISISSSIKPEHMPVRFHLTADNIVAPESNYDEEDRSSSVLDHFRFGTEFLLGKKVELRAGYSFGTRRELRLEQRSGGAGLGFGFLIKLKKADFSFSRSYYHVSGGTTFITLNTNINYFKKGI